MQKTEKKQAADNWKERYGSEKRYHTLNHYCQSRWGTRVFKLSLDAGFTCPNRDGSKGWGGCSFCSGRGSGDFTFGKDIPLQEQLQRGVQLVAKKWQTGAYIAYFQAFSNTYAPIEILRQRYEEALRFPGVVGLAIATRPDCLSEEVCDLLAEYQQKTFLWVEMGLQTIHEATMQAMNLGYSWSDFLQAAARLQQRSIPLCTHIILGLPGETVAQMHQTVEALLPLHLFGLKLHMLHILRGTRLGYQYQQTPFPLFSREAYVSLVVDLLEKLPPEVVIHRVTGDGPKEQTLAPVWSFHKLKVLSDIDREFRLRDSWQGKFYRQE